MEARAAAAADAAAGHARFDDGVIDLDGDDSVKVDTGGVVGINLYLDFVGGGHMDDLIAHIEHFLSLSGESTVAIGGDLDGCEALAAGMTGVQDVAKLYQALEERGYPQSLLEDIFWNNWRRIL